MKRTILISAASILAFMLTYLAVSFMIPGFRIKLAAPPMEYFIKSIRHMVLLKCSASLIIGATAGLVTSHFVK